MASAMGARFLRAMVATCSAIDAQGRSCSTTCRFKATEPMRPSACRFLPNLLSRADLEIDRAGEGVGDRRPLLDVGYQRIDLALRHAFAFHVDLDADVGETDRLFADIAGAPDGRNVEVTLEFQFELVDRPAAMHGIGMKPDRQTGTECRERSFGGIWRGVVAE